MEIKDSKTFQNLKKAYEGELKSSTRYRLFAEKARDDGYEQIGGIFDETSGNETEHAELFLKELYGGKLPSTLENLKIASESEAHEWSELYKNFAQEAQQEGFLQISELFRRIANIEHAHDIRFQKLANNIEAGKVFCKEKEMIWICRNCGNLWKGKCAPKVCPVCGVDQGFYQLSCNNY